MKGDIVDLSTSTIDMSLRVSDGQRFHSNIRLLVRHGNPQRRNLLVARGIFKYDCEPLDAFEQTCAELAALVPPGFPPCVVIGLTEAAVGIGFGVYRHLGARALAYMCTTRAAARRPLIEFREPHSLHPSLVLDTPRAALQPIVDRAPALLVVEDELTTGETMSRLLDALGAVFPAKQIAVVTCLDLSARDFPAPVHSLVNGRILGLTEQRPPAVEVAPIRHFPTTAARGLVHAPVPADVLADVTAGRVLVLGCREAVVHAISLAQRLARQGAEVWCQTVSNISILEPGRRRSSIQIDDLGFCQPIDADRWCHVVIVHERGAATVDFHDRLVRALALPPRKVKRLVVDVPVD